MHKNSASAGVLAGSDASDALELCMRGGAQGPGLELLL
jgi:hypothetical protein